MYRTEQQRLVRIDKASRRDAAEKAKIVQAEDDALELANLRLLAQQRSAAIAAVAAAALEAENNVILQDRAVSERLAAEARALMEQQATEAAIAAAALEAEMVAEMEAHQARIAAAATDGDAWRNFKVLPNRIYFIYLYV